ncbi:hypothetical protein STRCI_008150 [Streptomyces cinnabarinus]|uniref:Uncharacterized protein n=1 Tax=Streptomyces cinnabarinus TaxID=67287 RepID=A0ABY7KQD9_9ACTN|nr:hypothetical protein [Streptomyces cinnabarinus]WAZ26559.1 hypothetical protein STRCI_008150 [Streptomyces cinnabarinus]
MQSRSHTEATRLLCAGAYLDADFRRRVIEQLVEHEERPVAPSLGIDAVAVLGHALRARAQELQVAVVMLLAWAAFFALEVDSGGLHIDFDDGTWLDMPVLWAPAYGVLCCLLWAGRVATGRSIAVYTLDRGTLKRATHGIRRLTMLLPQFPRFLMLVYWATVLCILFTRGENLYAVFFPLLMAVVVWLHRSRVVWIMSHQLDRDVFPLLPPARMPATRTCRRIAEATAREQYAGLVLHDPFRPFVGAGKPYEPWSFAIELKPKQGAAFTGRPLSTRAVIDLVRPRVEALRESMAATSRDRLGDLEIDEVVYLPAGDVPRTRVSYDPAAVAWHIRNAVDEGGEARRHFLRIRIGAWEEQIVVTVLVRVHTQGGMLVLEVAPHVLTPIRPEFAAVDVITARAHLVLHDGLRALLTSPTATFASGVSALGTMSAVVRTWLADPQRALPDGPTTSVRELGSVEEISLFQEMDVSRYVKTVQDRITSGVLDALRAEGYETGEFEQQVVQVSGGVYIGAMSGGAVAVGSGARAESTS